MFKTLKSISILVALSLVVAVGIAAAPLAGAAGDPPCGCGDICVNTTGWWPNGGNFTASGTPIQDAVNNATPGDVICVKDGNYNENVVVNTAHLTIQSENGTPASCVVSASNSSLSVFNITANYVNITGLTLQGATGFAGIELDFAYYCNISGNNATNNHRGIYLGGGRTTTTSPTTMPGTTPAASTWLPRGTTTSPATPSGATPRPASTWTCRTTTPSPAIMPRAITMASTWGIRTTTTSPATTPRTTPTAST